MVETVFNCQNLYFGVSRCYCQAGAVVRTFMDGARLPVTAGVIFCRRLEVIGSVFLVFERVVFLNIGKRKLFSVLVAKKWEKWAGYSKL